MIDTVPAARPRRRAAARLLRAGACAASVGALLAPAAHAKLPHPPAHWPRTLQLGLADPAGDAAALRRSAPLALRAQYLSGGANTGKGWATWNRRGTFVSRYVRESLRAHMTPVFTYYQLRQSTPGARDRDEPRAVLRNLADARTMRAWFEDLALALKRAGAFHNTRIVLHVEPDLWGYVQQRAVGDDAATVPAAVAATGLPALRGLPDTAAGLARAIVRLRWRTSAEGGRHAPPTGPRYAANARFARPGLVGIDFGVMLDLAPDGATAALSLLLPDDLPTAAERIRAGERLLVLEGPRIVAEAEVEYVADGPTRDREA